MQKRSEYVAWPRALRHAFGMALLLFCTACSDQAREAESGASGGEAMDTAGAIGRYITDRKELDSQYWANEVKAQEYERTFIDLWDDLRAQQDKYGVLRNFVFSTISIGSIAGAPRPLELGIEKLGWQADEQYRSREEFLRFLDAHNKAGYAIIESEFHHARFEQQAEGSYHSLFSFTLHIENQSLGKRYILKGNLAVLWSDRQDAQKRHIPDKLRVQEVSILQGSSAQQFVQRMPGLSIAGPLPRTSPTLVYDISGDDLAEIILPNLNAILDNQGELQFKDRSISDNLPQQILSAVLADMTGDGVVDLLVGGSFKMGGKYYDGGTLVDKPRQSPLILLFEGRPGGQFAAIGRCIFGPDSTLVRPTCISTGDADGDGDQDIWLSQYKLPYLNGDLPSPYYDANDGFHSYLLLNEGRAGRFRDATEAAGLAPKRTRRTYSHSFADLDEDGDQDLLVVSDFAGIDVYDNDGRGNFTDITARAVDKHFNFGMSHTFGDYNCDGRLDFYVLGMSSTTARRLEAMNAGRPDFEHYDARRMDMAYGNRMYLARGGGVFRQPEFKDDVARTGWAWGSTSFDFDNDGDCDIYATNGHISRESAVDYCTHFWRDDIYRADCEPTEDLNEVYTAVFDTEDRKGYSWNGFEHNPLLMNIGGNRFVNVGFLLGVSLEQDCRNLVSEDFDGDGRMDILLLTYKYPGTCQVFLLHNNLNLQGRNWIGVRLQDAPGNAFPVGARIQVQTASGTQPALIVNGDSWLSQHSLSKHFGLGSATAVRQIRVRWPNGRETVLENPAINRYHTVSAPGVRAL